MVAFGLEITDKKAIPAIMEVRSKLLLENIVLNPFNGKITTHGKDFFTVILNPVYPRVYLFSFFPMILVLFGWGHWWGTAGLIIACVMFSTIIFWSNSLYFLLFKYKTKGGVRYVSAEDSLVRVA